MWDSARIVSLVRWVRQVSKAKIIIQKKLELVHTNLCGPIGIENYRGEKLFILFVDDYSRMMIVMYLKKN